MFSSLFAHIARYVALTSAEEALLQGYLSHQPLARHDFLLVEGQVCLASYFVLRGCLRTYFLADDGTAHTTQIIAENGWVTDYTSLDAGMPSQYFIQAVEATEVVVFSQRVQDEVLQLLPKLERYFRLLLQRATAAAQFRVKLLFSLSGEARYHLFSQALPGVVQQVSPHMLAPAATVAPEALGTLTRLLAHARA
ncbi:MAG: Crp/Fnr family transcriptional regulator [Janthinobacterium lividum]